MKRRSEEADEDIDNNTCNSYGEEDVVKSVGSFELKDVGSDDDDLHEDVSSCEEEEKGGENGEDEVSEGEDDWVEPGYMKLSPEGLEGLEGEDESDSSTQHLMSEHSVVANEMLGSPRVLVDDLMSNREKKFDSDLFDNSHFQSDINISISMDSDDIHSHRSSHRSSHEKEVESPPKKNGKSFISPQGISDFPFPSTPRTPTVAIHTSTNTGTSNVNSTPTLTPQSGISSMPSFGSNIVSIQSFEENEARESCQNAERLNILGGKLLSLGRNDEAIEVFSHAALCAKSDLMRIKRLIQRSSRRRFASLGSSDSSASAASGRSNRSSASASANADPEEHHRLMMRIASTIADIFNNTGVAYEMMENYDKAIASCKDALKVYKNTCGRREHTGDEDVDRTLHNIKQMELGKATLEHRRDLHAHASSLAKEALRQDNKPDKTFYIDDALTTLRTALAIERKSLGNSHPTVARTLMEVAKLHVEKETFDTAFQEMSQAVRLLRHSLGSHHPDVGRALATLAALFDQRNQSTTIQNGDHIVLHNDRQNAITLYREALRALRASLGEEHPEVGATFNNIGALFYAEALYDKALTSFTAARKAYGGGKLAPPASPAFTLTVDYLAEIILIWHNIGEVHLQKDEPRKALTAYNSALILLKDPNIQKNRSHLNQTIQHKTLSESGIRDENTNFATAFSLLPTKMDVDFQILTASTLQSMASIQSVLGVYGQSIAMYQDALRIRKRRINHLKKENKSKTNNDAIHQNSVEIAHIIESLGGIYELKEDLESAMKYYLRALNRYKSFHHIYGPDVALLLGKIGSIHFYMEEYQEAVTTFAESIELFKQHGVTREHPVVKQIEARLEEAETLNDGVPFDEYSVQSGISSAISEIYGVDEKQKDHSFSARNYEMQASNLRKQGDYESAINLYKKALSHRRERCAEFSPTISFERRRKEHTNLCRNLVKLAEIHIERKELAVARPLLIEVVRTCKLYNVSTRSKLVRYSLHLLDGIKTKRSKELNDL